MTHLIDPAACKYYHACDLVGGTCQCRDWYQVLGLSSHGTHSTHVVTKRELRRARNKRLRELAPGHDTTSSEYIAVTDAFEVLSTDKARYDSFGHADMTLIRPRLFLGTEQAARHTQLLKCLGVTHVLTCAFGMTDLSPALGAAGIRHLQFHVEDDAEQDLRPYLADGAAFVQQALDSGGAVLIHCQHGQSRSPTFAAFYLMMSEGLGGDAAMRALQQKRHKVNPIPRFRTTLREVQKRAPSDSTDRISADRRSYKVHVVGDVHGDFDQLMSVLRHNHVIDVDGNWILPQGDKVLQASRRAISWNNSTPTCVMLY